MKTFHCDACNNQLFFENFLCTRCEQAVGFLPDRMRMATQKGKRYRPCRNYEAENVCNWMVREDDPEPLCLSCRLTRVIPDLGQPANREAWYKLESAKRRLIYSLLDLGLPVMGKDAEPRDGLAFEFRADEPGPEGQAVLTGHDEGVITVNVAEADDAERERRRVVMHEPYRTLLGHFRHEIGHYYWNLLIRDTDRIGKCRELFGDERADYAQSLQRHYEQGPPADWQSSFVTAYAASHPWEDWAETWAHYLHMTDCLDTAAACGVALHPEHRDEPHIARIEPASARDGFGEMEKNWFALTWVFNNLNRSMGLGDAYPFLLPARALAKLRFVHEVVVGYDAESDAAANPVREQPAAAATVSGQTA